MYESYATIYDLAQQGRFGEQMARWALDWLAEQGEAPKQVLDLACGTGAAALTFAQAGCKVLGIDRSQAMLGIAQAKARDIGLDVAFIEADMVDILTNDQRRTTKNLHGKQHIRHSSFVVGRSSFDLVTCFADSLNYLTKNGDLEQVFAGAAGTLGTGGWLIFDINTEAEYATWDERDVVACDTADLMLYQKLSFDHTARLGSGKIGWLVREIDRWWRGEEMHIQRAWRDAEVRAALNEAGFSLVLAETTPDTVDGRRFLYVGRKM